MRWKLPPKIKIYEALGALGDNRLELATDGARVRSSDGSKIYTVRWDKANMSISSDDNGSRWVGYLGYPAITLLLRKKMLKYSKCWTKALAGIPWKKINAQFKNNYADTLRVVHNKLLVADYDVQKLQQEVDDIYRQIKELKLNKIRWL